MAPHTKQHNSNHSKESQIDTIASKLKTKQITPATRNVIKKKESGMNDEVPQRVQQVNVSTACVTCQVCSATAPNAYLLNIHKVTFHPLDFNLSLKPQLAMKVNVDQQQQCGVEHTNNTSACNMQHFAPPNRLCNICNAQFYTEEHLRIHRITEHSSYNMVGNN
jgi:hypothetical protein